jgi:hypothetical protein
MATKHILTSPSKVKCMVFQENMDAAYRRRMDEVAKPFTRNKKEELKI